MGPPRWVSNFDAFRTVPKDLAEASPAGALMTMIAAVTCTVLFLCETSAFLSAKPTHDVVLDSNQDAQLKINFDVSMLDMNCDYVTVGVWDAFGSERMNITRNIEKQRIDHKGDFKGSTYSEEELVELEFSDQSFTKDEKAEMDADWSSTSDQFKHDDFSAVVDAHDFTMVNFYADWCPHCRHLGPIWDQFENQLNTEEVVDADGQKANVRVLKINCVDFEATCQEQKVMGFPNIRLYRRGAAGKNWDEFQGAREVDAFKGFVKEKVSQRHTRTGAHYHDMFKEGCRIKGSVEVARVPGTLHFQAMHTKEKTLNLAFTNVSHRIHHFSFGDAAQDKTRLPAQYHASAFPLDGRDFTVSKFHMAPHHFIKVVHTRFESQRLRIYQQTHQWSVRSMPRKTVPQAKLSYDLSPVEVLVRTGDRRWYDYLTSVFAIIGGAFTFMSMASGLINFGHAKFKAGINKLG